MSWTEFVFGVRRLLRRRYGGDVDAAGGDFYVGFASDYKRGVLWSNGLHEY